MRRPTPRLLALTGTAGLVAIGGLVVGLEAGGGGAAPAAAGAPAEATVTVARGDLRQVATIPGELGYGQPWPVTGHGSGIVTWLPSAGIVVHRGEQLYRVDDRPVVLLRGTLPLYRTLADKPGKDKALPRGHDVDLVAANLAALGFYDGDTVDAVYDWTLAHAVAQWQASLGIADTGVLTPADVVVAAGPVRVDSVTAHLGDPAASPLLTVTRAARVVTLHAPVTLAQGLAPGDTIRVTLGDGRRVRTTVTAISGTTQDAGDGSTPSIPVTVAAAKPAAIEHAPLGAVSASVTTASRHDVLHVPVAALLALAGGGYALERADHTLVPVRIGMVAGGVVEVTGVPASLAVVVAG